MIINWKRKKIFEQNQQFLPQEVRVGGFRLGKSMHWFWPVEATFFKNTTIFLVKLQKERQAKD